MSDCITTALRRSGSGRPPTTSSKQLSNKLKRLVLNKRRRSTRNVAPKMNVSKFTVLRNLKKLPNHTIQHWKLNPQLHLSKWQRLVNTDFSKSFRLTPQLNFKNDIIWCTSRQDADKHGGYYGRENFSPGVMLWGGISWNGLIPREAPVFIDEFLEGYQWPK
ncbi:unnamed protein product [Rotaria sordida]|uniref:Transposase Tc1-like domain-containing protein n=1 Tax=Rotaria sordida TaxID=392033 RepID=A0A815J4H1_9BILA|nr:unnamed protein product [Rotaria sordida]CAF3916103.1 unnamed protein product [Rotaria sordida]